MWGCRSWPDKAEGMNRNYCGILTCSPRRQFPQSESKFPDWWRASQVSEQTAIAASPRGRFGRDERRNRTRGAGTERASGSPKDGSGPTLY